MTLAEIKAAVTAGARVCWGTRAYEVIHDEAGQWLIWCRINDHCVGLTHRDGVTMNGAESEFFVDDNPPPDWAPYAKAKA